MEAAGLAISIASLAGLAQTAVDFFQYIQLGKNFGTDFQTTCIRLNNAQSQLSRWGKSLELYRQQQHATISSSLPEALGLPAQDIKQAESLLGQIINLFQQAEETSQKFKTKNKDASVMELQDGLTKETKPLHHRMRAICLARQKNTSRVQKTKWVLYKKQDLTQLVDGISQLVGDLVTLFPATVPAQEQLCEREAAELQQEAAALPVLKEVTAAGQDRVLELALERLSSNVVSLAGDVYLFSCMFAMLISSVDYYDFDAYVEYSDNTKVVSQVAGNQTVYGGQTISF